MSLETVEHEVLRVYSRVGMGMRKGKIDKGSRTGVRIYFKNGSSSFGR